MNYSNLIGLELSEAAVFLHGKEFRLEYYTSDKQKIFDKELILRAKENSDGTLTLTVGRFLFNLERKSE